jgi:hypothetical protein
MKASIGTIVAIGALSLIVWTVVYIINPSTPLTQAETIVVVAVCAGLVLGVQWIVSRLSRPRGSDEPHS